VTSTALSSLSLDPIVPSVPRLSLVPTPRLSTAPAAPAPVAAAPLSDPSDGSAPAARPRPRFKRLVVFTGQLS